MKQALLSVSEKAGIEELGRALAGLGFELLSTGGTARTLRAAGLAVREVSDFTGTPEVMDGRVKTLHPRVFASVLADLDSPEHRRVLAEWGLEPISVVVVNLYPFVATAARAGVSADELIENIDIGGPSLIRAAAKNHRHVTVVVDPADYPRVVAALREGETPLPLRRELALKAFRHTAAYDATIAGVLPRHLEQPGSLLFEALAPWLGGQESALRYGENPHQQAVLVRPVSPGGLGAFHQLQGKELSYNNLQDTDGAWRLVWDLPRPGVAIVKHAAPCGVGVDARPLEAYRQALACDPVSAFGGVIASSHPVDEETALALAELFAEVVVAPAYSPEALAVLAGKKGLRVLEAPRPAGHPLRLRTIDGGLLIQTADEGWEENWQTVTAREPSEGELEALHLAWRVAKHTLSNAIVMATGRGTVGIGGGQPSRVDAARVAIGRARSFGLPLSGTAAGSDAFFPFPDGVEVLAEAGVTAIAQPGGSVRDREVIAAADRLGLAMVFTGRRHFRH
ncbi:MAG TPA: bifunctional phosphoribosylaminoimidazolecarboxamide formyltransferase/IMP cyclohydrolase [Thermoanaerobaculaceae bacterium]|nr:bifunctional phosphoribosylaminoimidazolecarboxamide formyltransferase/IMP cyclohydrolase [Thermoanaerobaculaceae bacterium]HRS17462.1 bifunctional phosphoribosylaminoimidazolecarboxamide formyltransferase/IMP cyclohydrolase [Thermoanaerobaculaceae bacterium]